MKRGTLEELIPNSKAVVILTGARGLMMSREAFLKEYQSSLALEYYEKDGQITDGMETFYVLGVDPTFDPKHFIEVMKKAGD